MSPESIVPPGIVLAAGTTGSIESPENVVAAEAPGAAAFFARRGVHSIAGPTKPGGNELAFDEAGLVGAAVPP